MWKAGLNLVMFPFAITLSCNSGQLWNTWVFSSHISDSHLPHSPDLPPCESFLFPKMKFRFKGHGLEGNSSLITEAQVQGNGIKLPPKWSENIEKTTLIPKFTPGRHRGFYGAVLRNSWLQILFTVISVIWTHLIDMVGFFGFQKK